MTSPRSAHVGRHVGELGRDPVESGRGVGERRATVERGEGDGHRVGRAPSPVSASTATSAASRCPVASASDLGLVAQALVLVTVGEGGGRQLVDLEAQQVDLPGPLALVAPEGGERSSMPASSLRAVRSGSRSMPPKRSRARRCTAGVSSDWWSCWPWRSTSDAPRSASSASVARWPST